MMLLNNDTKYTQNSLAGVVIKLNLCMKLDSSYDPTNVTYTHTHTHTKPAQRTLAFLPIETK